MACKDFFWSTKMLDYLGLGVLIGVIGRRGFLRHVLYALSVMGRISGLGASSWLWQCNMFQNQYRVVRNTEIIIALPRELGRDHFSFFIFHVIIMDISLFTFPSPKKQTRVSWVGSLLEIEWRIIQQDLRLKS